MLQIGLIGTGYWGPNLARSIESTNKASIRWLCDLDSERLAALSAKYPLARTTRDYEEILADENLDGVAISTPATTHFAIANRAIEAKKHVLVEKPMTENSEQAIRLIQNALKQKVVLMVGHVFEYNSTVRALKQLIVSGELGSIYYINFERTNLGPVRTDVNALVDLASHDVSIMCFLLDSTPQDVTARGQAFLNAGVEDAVFTTFTFPQGTIAHVHASWLNPRKVRRITVVGSRKMAIWDDLDLKNPIQIFDKRIDLPGEIPDTYMAYKTIVVEGNTFTPKIQLNQPLLAECEHFIDCIENKGNPLSDGYSGLRVVLSLEAAMKSMANHSRIVTIEIPNSV